MPYTPIQVGNHFILEPEFGRIGFIQLQKFLYMAHGWHLAMAGEPLFEESIEAWQFGPVYRSVYSARKGLNLELPIPPVHAADGEAISDSSFKRFLKVIYNRYHRYTAQQLIALTHAPGTPWFQITKPYFDKDEELPRYLIIPDEIIKKHFEELWDRGRAKTKH